MSPGPEGLFALLRAQQAKQVGIVVIEDDVEIGANTTIDRGSLDDTVIGAGSMARMRGKALVQAGAEIVGVAARTKESAAKLAAQLGGEVENSEHKEYGHGKVELSGNSKLFEGIDRSRRAFNGYSMSR